MYFEDIEVGKKYMLDDAFIAKEEIISFAKEYDPLFLHIDENLAKKSRFGGLIAPGMLTSLIMWRQFVAYDVLGEELIAGMHNDIHWLAPVYANSTIHGVMTVANKEVKNSHTGIITLHMEIFNEDNVQVTDNNSYMLIARKPS